MREFSPLKETAKKITSATSMISELEQRFNEQTQENVAPTPPVPTPAPEPVAVVQQEERQEVVPHQPQNVEHTKEGRLGALSLKNPIWEKVLEENNSFNFAPGSSIMVDVECKQILQLLKLNAGVKINTLVSYILNDFIETNLSDIKKLCGRGSNRYLD